MDYFSLLLYRIHYWYVVMVWFLYDWCVVCVGLIVVLYYVIISGEVVQSSGEYYVATPSGIAVFNCFSSLQLISCSEYRLVWLVNGTVLEDTNLTNINATTLTTCGVGYLRFSNIPLEYNMTNVECRADLNSGRNFTSKVTVLLLQGEFISANIREMVITDRGCSNCC